MSAGWRGGGPGHRVLLRLSITVCETRSVQLADGATPGDPCRPGVRNHGHTLGPCVPTCAGLTACSFASAQETLRLSLTEEKEAAARRLAQERELAASGAAQRDALKEEVQSLQREREESLRQLEREMQQVRAMRRRGPHTRLAVPSPARPEGA